MTLLFGMVLLCVLTFLSLTIIIDRMNTQNPTFKDYVAAVAVGLLFAAPFLIELAKDVL